MYMKLRLYHIQSLEDYDEKWDNYCRAPTGDLYSPIGLIKYDLYVFCGSKLTEKLSDVVDMLNNERAPRKMRLSEDEKNALEEANIFDMGEIKSAIEANELQRIYLVPAFIDHTDKVSYVLDAMSLLPDNPKICLFGVRHYNEDAINSLISWWKTYFTERNIQRTSFIEELFSILFHIRPAILRELVSDIKNPMGFFDNPKIRALITHAHSFINLSSPMLWEDKPLNLSPNPFLSFTQSIKPSALKSNEDLSRELLIDILDSSRELLAISLDMEEVPDIIKTLYFPSNVVNKLQDVVVQQKDIIHQVTDINVQTRCLAIDMVYRFNLLNPIIIENVFNDLPLSFDMPFIKVFNSQTRSPIYKLYKPATALKGTNYLPYIDESLLGIWRKQSTEWRLINDIPASIKKSAFHLNIFIQLNALRTETLSKPGIIKERNTDGTFDVAFTELNKTYIIPHLNVIFIGDGNSQEYNVGQSIKFFKPRYNWAVAELTSRTRMLTFSLIINGDNNNDETRIACAHKIKELVDRLYSINAQFNQYMGLYNPPHLSESSNIASSIVEIRNVISLNIGHKGQLKYEEMRELMEKMDYYVSEDRQPLERTSKVEYWTGKRWVSARIEDIKKEVVETSKERTYDVVYHKEGKEERVSKVLRKNLRYADYFFMRWNLVQMRNRKMDCRIGIDYSSSGRIVIENAPSKYMLTDITNFIKNFIYALTNNRTNKLTRALPKDAVKEDEDEIKEIDDFEQMLELEEAEAELQQISAPDEGEIIEEVVEVENITEEPVKQLSGVKTRTAFLLNRLREVDTNLFDFEPETEEPPPLSGEFSGRIYLAEKREATDKAKYSYTRRCPYFRRPVVITDEEKEALTKSGAKAIVANPKTDEKAKWCRREKISTKECNAIRYGSSEDNEHWYICPRIFDAYEGHPLTIEELEFKRDGFKPTEYTTNKKNKRVASDLWRTDKKTGQDILEFEPSYKGRTVAQSYNNLGQNGTDTIWMRGDKPGERDMIYPGFMETNLDKVPHTICCFNSQKPQDIDKIMSGTWKPKKGVNSGVKKDWGASLAKERLGLLSKELLFYMSNQTISDQYNKYKTDDIVVTPTSKPFYREGLDHHQPYLNAIEQAYGITNIKERIVENLTTNIFLELNGGNLRVEFDNPYTIVKAFQTYLEFLYSNEEKPLKYLYDLLSHNELYKDKNASGLLIILFDVVYTKTTEELTVYIPGYCAKRLEELRANIEEVDIIFLLRHHGAIDLMIQANDRSETKQPYKRLFKFGELPIRTRYIVQTLFEGRKKLLKRVTPLTLLENIFPGRNLGVDDIDVDYQDIVERSHDKYKSYVVNDKNERIGIITKGEYYIPISTIIRPTGLPDLKQTINVADIAGSLKSYTDTEEYIKRVAPELWAEPIYLFKSEGETVNAILNAKGLVYLIGNTSAKEIEPKFSADIREINRALYEQPKRAIEQARYSIDEVISILEKYGYTEYSNIFDGDKVVAIAIKYKSDEVLVAIKPVTDNRGGRQIEDIRVSAKKYIRYANELKHATEDQLPCMVLRGYMNDNKEYTGLVLEGNIKINIRNPISIDENSEIIKEIITAHLSYDVLEPPIIQAMTIGELPPSHKEHAVKDFIFKEIAGLLQRHEMKVFRTIISQLLTEQNADNKLRSKLTRILKELGSLIAVKNESMDNGEFDKLELPLTRCRGWTIMKNPVCICKRQQGNIIPDFPDFTVNEVKELRSTIAKYRKTNKCALAIPSSINLSEVIKSIVTDIITNYYRRYQLLNNIFKDINDTAVYHTNNTLEEIITENCLDERYRCIDDLYRKQYRKFYRGFLPYGEADAGIEVEANEYKVDIRSRKTREEITIPRKPITGKYPSSLPSLEPLTPTQSKSKIISRINLTDAY